MSTSTRQRRKQARARAAAQAKAHEYDNSPRINLTPGMRAYLCEKMPHAKDMIAALGNRVPVAKIEELKALNDTLSKLTKDNHD